MSNRLTIITAAALAVGGLSLAPDALGQQSQQPGGQPGGGGSGVASQAGAAAQNAHASDVKFVIARVTDAALSERGNAQLLAYLSDQDRQRLSQDQDAQPDAQLQQSIQKLNHAWQQKYNRAFDIGTRQLAFDDTGLRVIAGDTSDAARTAGERIPGGTGTGSGGSGSGASGSGAAGGSGDASGGTSGAGAGAAGGSGAGAGAGSGAGAGAGAGTGASARGDVGPSGERISAIIPQDAQAPTVILHLTRAGATDGTWKIDLPDTVDAKKLQGNLQRHLAMISDQPGQLPASEDEAYVLVAHHVLAALTDAEGAEQRGDMDRAGGQGANRPGEQGGSQRQPPQDQAPPRTPGDTGGTGGSGSGTGGTGPR